jgi:hypothetical protein
MKPKTRLFIISILILLASAHVIISGAAHNVPKVGLAYDPMNNSLQIIHINPPPESTMNMGTAGFVPCIDGQVECPCFYGHQRWPRLDNAY